MKTHHWTTIALAASLTLAGVAHARTYTAADCPDGLPVVELSQGQQPTDAAECIIGTGGADLIDGKGGDDVIFANAGADEVRGGPGDDFIRLNEGDDTAWGDDGDDTIYGGKGADVIEGGPGDDVLYGRQGGDTLRGQDGNDTLQGNKGNDTLDGGSGFDVGDGGKKTDTCEVELAYDCEAGTGASGLDPEKVLVVRDEALLAGFGFERTMNALADSVGGDPTGLQLAQMLFATQNPPVCDGDINGFDLQCPRAEGGDATMSGFDEGGEPLYIPIGLFNRFDLTDTGGSDCGEYRIVYARRSGIASATDRNLLIFEAVLPNPNPGCGLESCRPVAEFWAGLNGQSDADRRAALESFYYQGLSGFAPVVQAANFAPDAGQVRTNQFRQNPWTLRELRLETGCGSDCPRWLPDTVKGNPHGPYFNAGLAAGESFRQSFVGQVDALAGASLFDIGMQVPADALDAESVEQSGSSADYSHHYTAGGGDGSAFGQSITTALGVSDLTATDIVNRAETQSCAGCHQLSNGVDLGGDLTWPSSLGFVHISERGAANGQFAISSALTDTFLPERQAVLEQFLTNRGQCSPTASSLAKSAPATTTGRSTGKSTTKTPLGAQRVH